MLSESEKLEISEAKEKIREKLIGMVREPWANGYILPWNKMYLTGGAVASILNGEEPNDYDIYFMDFDSMNGTTEHLRKHEEHIADVNSKYAIGNLNGKMVTAKAITMKNKWSFITMICGTPAEVRKSFDYVHCRPYYSFDEQKLYISEKQYRACKEKKLIVNNPLMVKDYRRNKFIERGFKDE